MKTFLIIVGCILVYIFGAFITLVLTLYIDRCVYESAEETYEDIDEANIWISVDWPVTIWFIIGYLLYLKFKKFAIAIVEVLYQVNHKEDKDE